MIRFPSVLPDIGLIAKRMASFGSFDSPEYKKEEEDRKGNESSD